MASQPREARESNELEFSCKLNNRQSDAVRGDNGDDSGQRGKVAAHQSNSAPSPPTASTAGPCRRLPAPIGVAVGMRTRPWYRYPQLPKKVVDLSLLHFPAPDWTRRSGDIERPRGSRR